MNKFISWNVNGFRAVTGKNFWEFFDEIDADKARLKEIGINAIKEGSLENQELINFIKNDPYFSDNKFAEKYYRPLEIVNCLNFNTMINNFFNKWNDINIFKIYSFAESDLKIQKSFN